MRRGPIAPSLAGGRVFTSMNRMDRMTGVVFEACHCDPVLDAGVGNLDGVAMVVHRRVLNLTGIAAWFDRLTMSGCAPRNDRAALLTMTGRWWGYALTRHGGCGTRNVTLRKRRCCACDGK